jgi:hypothetical protein
MNIEDEVTALRKRVEALEDQLQIVVMMLAQPAPEPTPEPASPTVVQEPEPRFITDFRDINFPI